MFRDHIRRGIALLNRERPGWEKKIAVTKLDLSDGDYHIGACGCVLAQTDLKMMKGRGSFGDELDRLGIYGAGDAYGFNVNSRRAYGHGLSLTEGYDVLTKEWQDEIRKLRAQKAAV